MGGIHGWLRVLLISSCFLLSHGQEVVCKQEAVADIVFLVDGSASIGLKNFQEIREFLSSLVSNFDIAPNKVQIGMVQYSDTPRTEFLLNTFEEKHDILDYISRLPYKTGGTNTGLGLAFLLKEHFVEKAGSRVKQRVPQIAVVITDGHSQDEVEPYVEELRQKGIIIYAIGIKEADETFLKNIATEPYDQHVYSVSDFAALKGISQNVVKELCTSVEREILLMPQECREVAPSDIVLLVESSDAIGESNFVEIQRFLHAFVERLNIKPDKVRVGLVQYSDSPHQELLLGEYVDQVDLVRKVDNLRYRKGNANTGLALDFIRENYSSQLRKNVPHIAVVITDGESADAVEEPAQKLRMQGVITFVVKTGEANLMQVHAIANSPNEEFLFSSDSYQKLQELAEDLHRKVCIAVDDQLRAVSLKYADVFFLVDSTANKQESQQIRTMLTRLVNQLNVGKNTNRVGLAQFGEGVQEEFLLNTNKTKTEIVSSIRNLQLKPTGLRKIGDAIEHARKHFFNTAVGSRITQGFKQFLLVATVGKSDDSVIRPARTLKNEAVNLIAVGGGQSEMDELQDIASPTLSYRLDARTLPQLPQKVKAIVESKEPLPIPEDCRSAEVADIVFIVDESTSIGSENFQIVRNFLQNTISGLNVGRDKVRIAIVQYSDVPRADVYLNTFSDKSEILQHVQTLSYGRGGTFTGAALKFAKDRMFTKVRGSRADEHVQQIAVVITDGKSSDKPSEPAAELRRSGVTVFALGIKNINVDELKEIASYPPRKFVFNVESFAKLNALSSLLTRSLCGDINDAFIPLLKNITIQQGCKFTAEADIYFLLDESGSITYDDFDDMKAFILEFLHMFQIGPDKVRIGVVKFADLATIVFRLNTYDSKTAVEKAVKALFMEGGGTNTKLGLEAMIPLFQQAKETRKDKVRELLIVITDGKSQTPVKVPAEKLRNQNVTIYAVGVKDADEAELEEMSGSPKRTFKVKNYDALKLIKTKMLKEICSFEACNDFLADVVFLIDGADTVDSADFEEMKKLIEFAVEKLPVRENRVRVAVLQYSKETKVEFSLNAHYDKEKLQKHIMSIKQMKGKAFTGAALTEVSSAFQKSSGGRSNVLQVLVVLTDSSSKDKVVEPAKKLRENHINIYAVGMAHANRSELLSISGSYGRVYLQNTFGFLQDLGSEVVFKICNTECKRPELLDIIFLVDGAGSIAKETFQSIKTFMETVVTKTEFGEKRVRFGVIVYSDRPQMEFTLNQYYSKADVLKAISELQSLGGRRNTAQALKYALSYFSAAHGGRHFKEVPQVLLLITDGPVADSFGLGNWPGLLAGSGVNMFAIGVAGAREADLQTIARDNQRVFYVDNFQALETLSKPITQQLCPISKLVCEKEIGDLVILIDGSDSIHDKHWESLKKSIISLVRKLEIAPDRWRVGVAQFSDIFQSHFYLDKYSNLAGVEQGIRDISQRKQGTHTWAALRLIQEYFKPEQGSRINQKVVQYLLLVTDGNAGDKEDLGALAELKAKNIQIFVIGVSDYIKPQELLKIAGSKERVFRENFESLPLNATIDKLLHFLCHKVEIPDPQGCTIDIGIGFDVSHRRSSHHLISSHIEPLVAAAIHQLSIVGGLCCVPIDKIETKIGFRLVSGQDGHVLDDFNFEKYDENVVRKVLALRPTVSTAFNSLLLNSFRDKLSKSKAGVKVVVLFTDGFDDTLERLKESSERLRESGVNALLIVALSGNVDYQQVEFGRGFSYNWPLSINMLNVGYSLHKQIEAVASRECCKVTCSCSGSVGFPGHPGEPGPKGPPGLKGYPGFPGDEGGSGGRGSHGPNGTQGHQGCPGRRGFKGSLGYTGTRGEEGEFGLDGVDGELGTTGIEGASGPKGEPGRSGFKGVKGIHGPKGDRGVHGDPGATGLDGTIRGPKGEAGYAGPPGDQGPDGASGTPGPSGEPGLPGKKGPEGLTGVKSTVKGEPGPQGPPGYSGLRGKPGSNGAKGEKGEQGLTGVQGHYGTVGDKGAKGNQGRRGPLGLPGDMGSKGDPGLQGFRGAPGHVGADGFGLPGHKGPKGPPGFPGNPGLIGEDGNKGTKGGKGSKGYPGRLGNRGHRGPPGVAGETGHDGHRGPKGTPGTSSKTECEVVNYVREKCACCAGKTQCPVYPTELVIALDTSVDVTPQLFARMRSAALSLLEDIAVTETNCPAGARVFVVSYNTETSYLIRFSDYNKKKLLLDAVRALSFQRTRNRRNMGQAMRVVAQNVFKRVREGKLVRKVAIFFTNGPSEDASSISAAMLEFKALDISLGVLTYSDAPDISQAIQGDETGSFMVVDAQRRSRIKECVICFDRCNPDPACGIILNPPPEELDIDLTVMMDASYDLPNDQYLGVKELLVSLLEEVDVSTNPSRNDGKARIAVYQQSSSYHNYFKEEFGLNTFRDRAQMKRHISEDMKQVGGASRLDIAIGWMITNVILKERAPRKKQVVLAILAEDSGWLDKDELDYVSKLCMCKDVVLFTLTVGEKFSWTYAEELTTPPLRQHIVHLGRLALKDLKYAQRFLRAFLRLLTRDFFPKPSSHSSECSTFVPKTYGRIGPAILPGRRPTPPPPTLPVTTIAPTEETTEELIRESHIEIEHHIETSTDFYSELYEDTYPNDHAEQYTQGTQKPGTTETPTEEEQGQKEQEDITHQIEPAKSKAHCLLEKDIGTVCSSYELRWFYDRTTLTCANFWYGGCDGNSNRFLTQAECMEACAEVEFLLNDEPPAPKDVCQLSPDMGKCYQFSLKWHFDASKHECTRFWYGGCEGNGNRFETQEECEARCLRAGNTL
ncbi:collagen alpha-6(VI) chain [Hoplias malabaricus]|uniref:collagen alpha-6(VI) chain n=1 Tax=Hoplias malabaricus TaxID=27720 RepID=UPI00346193D9